MDAQFGSILHYFAAINFATGRGLCFSLSPNPPWEGILHILTGCEPYMCHIVIVLVIIKILYASRKSQTQEY
jgi:hypothetical protein